MCTTFDTVCHRVRMLQGTKRETILLQIKQYCCHVQYEYDLHRVV